MSKQVILRKNEDRRLVAGHLWAFSNEIKSVVGDPDAGDLVELLRHDEKFLGIGLYHPNSLIAVRLISRHREEISFQFFERRIREALELRRRIYPSGETFRLVHGESDFLPGLVIDKYNELMAIETFSAGMDRRLTLICDVLDSLFHPKAIVERNESPLRALEGLPPQKRVVRGTPDATIISESGVKFKVDVLNGQKTGAFLDQRENRRRLHRYAVGARVVDCFCNEGGFALHAASAGAREVMGFDVSEGAVARARTNATLNQFTNVTFTVRDAFEALKHLAGEQQQFDVAVLDPPSFARSRRTVATALRGYRELHELALRVLRPGGILATASCSHHIAAEDFFGVAEEAGRRSGRRLRLLETAGAAPDHPVLIAMPETGYLKFGIFAVT